MAAKRGAALTHEQGLAILRQDQSDLSATRAPVGIQWFRIPAMDAPEVGRRRLVPGPRGGKVCSRCLKGACGMHWLPASSGFIGGYYSTSRQGLHADPRAVRYHQWQEHVRFHSPQVGVRPASSCPLRVCVWGWFRSGVHCDAGNLSKGVLDCLFPPSTGGDKHVYAYDGEARIDPEHPEVIMAVGLCAEFAYYLVSDLEARAILMHSEGEDDGAL